MKKPFFYSFRYVITLISVVFLAFILIISCEQRDFEKVIAVRTDSVNDITAESARVAGMIIDLGEDGVISEYGHCWAIHEQPTIDDSVSVNENATDTRYFSSELKNLTPGATYYIRSFVRFGSDVEYGKQLSFTTIPFTTPKVATGEAYDVYITAASIGGTLSHAGAGVDGTTEYGHCWSTTSNEPTLENCLDKTDFGFIDEPAEFASELTYLKPNTTYYIRAYAINEVGTVYGDIISFTTKQRVIDQSKTVMVEGGTYLMGTDHFAEKPPHQVKLDNFYIWKTEITNSQFAIFMNQYKSEKVKNGEYAGMGLYTRMALRVNKVDGVWVVDAGYEDYPVVSLTWFGAYEYCKFYGGDLPTEAEWEYAARGGKLSKGYIYAGSDDPDEVARYNQPVSFNSKIIAVAQKHPNELGLYDMSGNIQEWCYDWYDENYYTYCNNMGTVANPYGPDTGKNRIVRGGACDSSPTFIRTTYRVYKSPFTSDSKTGCRIIFRLD